VFPNGGFDAGSGFDSGSGFEATFQSAPFEAPSERDAPAQSYEAAMGYEPGPAQPRPEPSQPSAARASNGASTWAPSSDPAPELDAGTARARSLALGDASKLAESLMIIHERTRGSLKSHSVRVARRSYSLCRQLDLSEAQAAQAWAIGLFHDLGKSQQNHLTALNVWQLADYEVTARAQYKNPARLLKNADVPETVLTAILHMYERFDGKGFPDGLADEAIPFQSRVVALCDSVADLTLNPANTLGRIVSPLEACNHIRAQTPKVFDPTLLAHFSRLLVERKLDGAFLSDQSVHGIEKLLA
jgi:HD-GYP domain-containing protein (c-di-GMP phosphodiesterase class II)